MNSQIDTIVRCVMLCGYSCRLRPWGRGACYIDKLHDNGVELETVFGVLVVYCLLGGLPEVVNAVLQRREG